MKTYLESLQRNLEASIRAKQTLLADQGQLEVFAAVVASVIRSYHEGGRLYIAGNGGSAADAQHLAAEFVCKLSRPRKPLPAEALSVDTSLVTAIGNDFGFDEVFARQIEGKMGPKDIFLAITTSGNSPNIVKALEKCREMNIVSVMFCGRGGGRARGLSTYCVLAPGESTSQVQEVHSVLCHTLCQCVEEAIVPELNTTGF